MESLVTSPGSPSANGAAPSAFPTIEPILVVEHLASVLEITLGATRKELENVGSLLSIARYPDTVQRCARFATESQVALYVQKDIATAAQVPDNAESTGINQNQVFFSIGLTTS